MCCTCNSSFLEVLRNVSFDLVIVDEAAQCIEPELLIPTQHKCRRLIMFGDHKQLPATVLSRAAERAGLGRSFFERLWGAIDLGVCRSILTTQYRMHPQICAFPNREFYGGALQTDASVLARPIPPWAASPLLDQPYLFFDAKDSAELVSGGR